MFKTIFDEYLIKTFFKVQILFDDYSKLNKIQPCFGAKLLDYLSDAMLEITGQLGCSDDFGSVSELHGLLPSSGQYKKRVYLLYGRESS